jgi:hypothetical protein
MRHTHVLAAVVLAIGLMQSSCYRYQSAACKQRAADYAARVERLRREALDKLTIGTNKEAVIQFFAENGIPVSFVAGAATGTVTIEGCAPAGCGSDAAYLGLQVKVDEAGTVTGEPVIGAIYADCL